MEGDPVVMRYENQETLGGAAPRVSITSLNRFINCDVPDRRVNSHPYVIWLMQSEKVFDRWIDRLLRRPLKAHDCLVDQLGALNNKYANIAHQFCRFHYQGKEMVEIGPAVGWSINSLTLVLMMKMLYLKTAIEGTIALVEKHGREAVPSEYKTPAVAIPHRPIYHSAPMHGDPDRHAEREAFRQESVTRVPLLPLRKHARKYRNMYGYGLLCFPHERIGAYSQTQLLLQVELLARSTNWIDVNDAEFRAFVDVMLLRLAELTITPWPHGSHELDVDERHRLCAVFCGAQEDPTRQSRATVLLQSINALSIANMAPVERRLAQQRRDDLLSKLDWTPSVTYITRVGAMIVGIKMAHRAYRLGSTSGALDDAAIIKRVVTNGMLVYVTRIPDLIARRAGVPNFGSSMGGSTFVNNMFFSEQQVSEMEERYKMMYDAFHSCLSDMRERFTESKYIEEIITRCRACHMPFGAAENAVLQCGTRNAVSLAEVERYAYSHESRHFMSQEWPKLPLRHFLESHHPLVVRVTAWVWVYQMFTLDTTTAGEKRWADRYFYTDKRFMKCFTERSPSGNREPFLFVMYASLFVWFEGCYVRCHDPVEALLLWTVLQYHLLRPEKRPVYLRGLMERIVERLPRKCRARAAADQAGLIALYQADDV